MASLGRRRLRYICVFMIRNWSIHDVFMTSCAMVRILKFFLEHEWLLVNASILKWLSPLSPFCALQRCTVWTLLNSRWTASDGNVSNSYMQKRRIYKICEQENRLRNDAHPSFDLQLTLLIKSMGSTANHIILNLSLFYMDLKVWHTFSFSLFF